MVLDRYLVTVNHLKARNLLLLDWLAILFLSLLLLSPILIAPHWGLFTDASQILSYPPDFIKNFPTSIASLGPKTDGRWNPLFHLLTILIYWLFGESARAFYLVQWVMLAITLLLIFQLTYYLTQRRRTLAWLAVLLAMSSGSLYENFFTLDKVEPRVGFFAILAFAGLGWAWYNYESLSPLKSVYVWLWFIAEFSLAVLALFSKETGLFLLPVAIVMAILWRLRRPRSAALPPTLIFLAAQLLTFLLFRGLFQWLAVSNEISYRYTTYAITPTLVFENLRFYLYFLPETVLAVALMGGWLVFQLSSGQFRRWEWPEMILAAAGLAGSAYFAGLLLWRWPGSYFMYPATIFLAISTAGLAFRYVQAETWPRSSRWRAGLILLLAVATIAGNLPRRLYEGRAIYAQDQAKDLLAVQINQIASPQTRLITAFVHPASTEVGERLEFFINRLRPDQELILFNMIEGPWVNRADLNRYQDSVAVPPSPEQLNQALSWPDAYIGWAYETPVGPLAQTENKTNWYFSPLQLGDWVIVPVGSPRNRAVAARGVSVYSQAAEAYLPYAPGVRLEKKLEAHVPVDRWGQNFLGWDVFEVIEAKPDIVFPQLSSATALSASNLRLGNNWYPYEAFNAETFRWVNNDAEVMVTPSDNSIYQLILEVEPGPGLAVQPFTLFLQNEAGHPVVQTEVRGREIVRLTLPKLTPDQSHLFRLHIEGGGLPTPNDPRLLNFRVFQMNLIKP